MSYELEIADKTGYLHATVTGKNTPENVLAYMSEVMQVCAASGCAYVLVEEKLEGPRLDTLDVFDIVSEGSQRGTGFFRAIAYVDACAEGELMEFAETVAVNRFMPVTYFHTVADAEQWLRNEVTRSSG
jgi:hypothetical protein